ncbi:type I methionyl aminopeptidase [Isoptericola variabilis]|uniref:Methionine aminopeptidase n=1 Tax=Isoptericola variabilis (strain 225) TaxID=743718 RepID=F6FWC2_ISOV2|nr:type I methionyl aminopeptidase [Isoptericola variabilis]AEG43466.1 methionine aminopeptidase, type I [Isoptericola variabilis 225]TWH31304.1 methionyl aminopeptidase [Isoptericola variabilis J7]
MFSRERIEYKSRDQVRVMRRAGLVVADALDAVRAAARPGATTADLDAVAAAVIADAGASPSFLGYHGFPATICTSVNEEVVHGIPGPRVLAVGDVVSVDCGAIVDGWHGDSAVSFVLGPDGPLAPDAEAPDPHDAALVRATEAAMWAGIAALASARRLNEVGAAVEAAVELAAESAGLELGIVEEYVGHGIGTAMHQPPDVVNYRVSDRGPKVRPGMCLAIEPMVSRGGAATRVLADDWTVVTQDGSRAAHWEHTVAVLEDGVVVLTARDGGAERLAALGVDVVAL